ncbi:hypothetical protein F4778DRAFT_637310 [Xylariomycetidae sp. FL2044]|nr:hypothetical protein F4778DRAFT_637310 [Xylariomycetidae sp. FL2044]
MASSSRIPARHLHRMFRFKRPRTSTLILITHAPESGVRTYHSSSAASQEGLDVNAIRAEMLSRPPQVTRDRLTPEKSHLLNLALAEVLPARCCAHMSHLEPLTREARHGDGLRESARFPAGHHLVYFPPQTPGSSLLSDGTEPFQSPGAPFVRRMWAGGSVWARRGVLTYTGRLAACTESIEDVTVQGEPGSEKIYVHISRNYSPDNDMEALNTCELEEKRTLVFMRPRTEEDRRAGLAQIGGRVIKAPRPPDFSLTLTPTRNLLFHFSALSYNAHAIHLDREHCRQVEGYRDLLVHGPLSLNLMLAVLESRLGPVIGDGTRHVPPEEEAAAVIGVEYRHLAPLYVDEPMRVCVRRLDLKAADEAMVRDKVEHRAALPEHGRMGKWEIWIEGPDGGLRVKGTAYTAMYTK